MSLSVGAPPLIAANVLPEVIKEFRSHRPDIRIQVSDVGGDALTQMVERYGYAFGIEFTTDRQSVLESLAGHEPGGETLRQGRGFHPPSQLLLAREKEQQRTQVDGPPSSP